MNIKWILLATSIVIIVCPIGGALLAYQGNLQALVLSEEPEFLSQSPDIKYLNYNVNGSTINLRFNFYNPYSMDLTIYSIDAEVFCADHNAPLGFINETKSVKAASKSNATVTLALTYGTQALMHFLTNHLGETALRMELHNLEINVQGIKVRSEQPVDIGTLPIIVP